MLLNINILPYNTVYTVTYSFRIYISEKTTTKKTICFYLSAIHTIQSVYSIKVCSKSIP